MDLDAQGELRRYLDVLVRIFRVLLGDRPGQMGCIYFPERVINRPDPCIYDQFLLMQLDLPVTWASPDVSILLGGVKQYTYDLVVGTTYDVVITVHNSSRDKPARGTEVMVRWIEFGAGAQIRHPIATRVADVPVWPDTITVSVPWTTPPTPGHYCIEVELFHPNDGNPANNRGWNNTQVKAAHSQVQSTIRIFNHWLQLPGRNHGRMDMGAEGGGPNATPLHHVELTVDSYVFADATGKDANPDTMFAPREAAWPARLDPPAFDFEPTETYRDVLLIVDAPDDAGPAEVFNVTARQAGVPLGGITLTVERA